MMKRKKLLICVGCVAVILLAVCAALSMGKAEVYEVKSPYAEPEPDEDQALIWLEEVWPADNYSVLYCSEELSCMEEQYRFDDGPQESRYSRYYGCMVTGLEPTEGGEIILLLDNGTPRWANIKKALVYDVTVSGDGQVTIGEARECTDYRVCYEFIADMERELPEDPYGNMKEDGTFTVVSGFSGGTPYSYVGALFDPDMFEKDSESDYQKAPDGMDGGGYTKYIERFTPKSEGETTVVILDMSYANGIEGRFFHITVEKDMRCRLDWYADGIMDEDFIIYLTIEGKDYLFP